MTNSLRVPATLIRRVIDAAVRGNPRPVQTGVGMIYHAEGSHFLVGGSDQEHPYKAEISSNPKPETAPDFWIQVDVSRGVAHGFDLRSGAMAPLPLDIRGKELTHSGSTTPTQADLSRLIGALGGDVAQRIAAAQIVIIGCGGIGAHVAGLLAQGGSQNLVLVDSDTLDLSNLHRMPLGYRIDQVGQPKVDVLSEFCLAASGVPPVTQAAPFGGMAGRIALRDADLIVVATDSVESRRLVASFASDFLIPAISVGVGVMPEGKVMEVGFSLPGETCLTCLMKLPTTGTFTFGEGRIGSLGSLNLVAAGITVQLIEEFAAGQIESSLHWRYVSRAGLHPLPHSPAAATCACSNRYGIGDYGLAPRRAA